MFEKKYIFETESTKSRRYLKNSAILFVVGFFFYLLIAGLLIVDSQNESRLASDAFYNKPPDLIVVFTGDSGRIKHALMKAREYKQSHIFITGVYSKNTVATFIKANIEANIIDPKLFEIDYMARNTLENVINFYRYLKVNPGHSRIMIISHDYHISRIKLFISLLQPANEKYSIYYSPVPSNYKELNNIIKLSKEVLKICKSAITLAFWEDEEQER